MSRRKEKKKIEQTTGKRINAADVMIILLAVVFIAGMVLRFGVIDKIERKANDRTATVSFIIEGVSEGNADYIAVGDEIFLVDGGEEIGVVASVSEPEQSAVYYRTDDGRINSYLSVDGKVDIRGSLTVKGTMTEHGFLLNGTDYIAPNMNLYVQSQKISVSILITNIEVAEK